MDPFELPEPEALAALDDSALSALREAAVAEGAALSEAEAFTVADADRLDSLASAVETIDAQIAANTEADAALAARKEASFAKLKPKAKDEAKDEEPKGKPFAAEVTEVDEAIEAALEGVIVAAAAAPSARQIIARAPHVSMPVTTATGARAIIASAADVPNVPGNTTFGSLAEAVPGMIERFRSYPQGLDGARQQHGLLRIQTPFPADLIATGIEDHKVVAHAINQSRLPGGGIIAAGGWCAPTPQTYDICTTGKVNGIFSLPEVQVPRGSLSYFRGIDYSAITTQVSAAALCYTNAQLIVDPPLVKDCVEIDCPSPVTMTLDSCVQCITAGILQQRAFPEYVAAWIEQALVVHAHRMNRRDILAAAALASVTSTIASTFGAISQLMDAIDLRATYYRYIHGLDDTDTLEVVLPAWIVGALRSDLIRRNTALADDLARAAITAYFANRNVAVQWVRDWQDAEFLAAAPGPVVWPGTATFLLYQAGALWRGVADVIRVDTLYDSTLLRQNRYQALFVEQGSKVALGCGAVHAVSFSICPSGATAGFIGTTPGTMVCPAP